MMQLARNIVFYETRCVVRPTLMSGCL